MDNIVNIRMLVENLIQPLLVRDIARVVLGSLARNELDAVDDFFGGVVEVVDDHDLVVGFEESERGEGADVAGATGRYCQSSRSSSRERTESVSECQWLESGLNTYPVTRTDPTTILSVSQALVSGSPLVSSSDLWHSAFLFLGSHFDVNQSMKIGGNQRIYQVFLSLVQRSGGGVRPVKRVCQVRHSPKAARKATSTSQLCRQILTFVGLRGVLRSGSGCGIPMLLHLFPIYWWTSPPQRMRADFRRC